MRVETLPSPGLLSSGLQLRTQAAKAISSIEILAGMPGSGGKVNTAKQLSDFFTACAAALSTFIDVTAPTVLSRTIPSGGAASGSWLRIRHSEALDPNYVPAPAAFTIAGVAKTIAAVKIEGADVCLRVTVPFVAGNAPTVAYTQPGAGTNLRDLSGNLLASYTATAVTAMPA